MARNCPKCHCGCLFEDHGKLVCLNCGHTCSKLAAEGVVHHHDYVTYTGKKGDKPTTVRQADAAAPQTFVRPDTPKPSADSLRQPASGAYASGVTGHVYPAAQRPSGAPSSRPVPPRPSGRPAQQRTGCIIGVVIFIIFLSMLFSFISASRSQAVRLLTETAQTASVPADAGPESAFSGQTDGGGAAALFFTGKA